MSFLHGDEVDLWIYESDGLPGFNHDRDEAAWGSLHAGGAKSPDTPCPSLCEALPYISRSVFLFMSLRKRVPCVPRELQTRVFTINHLRRKAPTRRCQPPKTELKVGGLNSKPRLEKWRKMQELSLCWSLS